MMAQNHIIVLIFFVIFSPGIAISGFPGFPAAFGLHDQNQTAFSQENVTTLEPLEFTNIPGEIKEPGAETIDEATGESTTEEVGPFRMQLELEQRTPDFPKMWHITEYTFEVDDLQLQQGENRNYRLQASDDSSSNIIVLHEDNIALSNIGSLEVDNETETMTETTVYDTGGFATIDKILRDKVAMTTTYILSMQMGHFFNIGERVWDNAIGNLTISNSTGGIKEGTLILESTSGEIRDW
jgi:hypothetical protein